MTKLETGYSYKYTPEKDREDREELRDRTCCGCGESSMERSDTINTTKYFPNQCCGNVPGISLVWVPCSPW